MARSGQFSKSGVSYGVPLSFAHPTDNKMPPQFDPALDDPSLALTDIQKQELQDRIDDLYHVLQGENKYFG
jgi:hypothetical protein